jgi:hypothetical protein
MATSVVDNLPGDIFADRTAGANLKLDAFIAVGADKLSAFEHALQRSRVAKLDRAADHDAALPRAAFCDFCGALCRHSHMSLTLSRF